MDLTKYIATDAQESNIKNTRLENTMAERLKSITEVLLPRIPS